MLLIASAAAANLEFVHFVIARILTCCHSLLSPKSYVRPRSHRPLRPIEYSQPLQKTAQLWNKSKEDLAGQLADLKSYVEECGTHEGTAY